MHIQIISSIIGWFVTTLGITTKVALAAKATAAAAAATKVALVAKATTTTAAAAKVALATKAAAGAKIALATKAAAATKVALAATKAATWSHLCHTKWILAKIAAHKTIVEITGAATTTGMIMTSSGLPIGPFPAPIKIYTPTPEEIQAFKNTLYGLYQMIPSWTFYEWIWNIGCVGYSAGGIYEGYKITKNLPNNQNVPNDDNPPLFPQIAEILNNLDISEEELRERCRRLHSYLLSLMYITNYKPDLNDGYTCSVCLEDNSENVFITQCRHVFCYECLFNHLCNQVINLNQVPTCPNCCTDMHRSQELPANIQNFVAQPNTYIPVPIPVSIPVQ